MTFRAKIQEIVESESEDLRRACELWLVFFETDFTGDPAAIVGASHDALQEMIATAEREHISKATMRRAKAIVAGVLLP